jgi:hypothetical protein
MFMRGSGLWFLISGVLLFALLVMDIANLPDRWMELNYAWLVPLFIVNLAVLLFFLPLGRPVAYEYLENFLSLSGKDYTLLFVLDLFFWAYLVSAPALVVLRLLLVDSTVFWGLFFANTHNERNAATVGFYLLLAAFNVLYHIRVFILMASFLAYEDYVISIAYTAVAVVALLLHMGLLFKTFRKIVNPTENVMGTKKALVEYDIGEEYIPFFRRAA